MTIEIADLPTTTFSTTRSADQSCAELTRKLGWHHRYVAARLAIARSLSLPTPPPPLTEEEQDDMATPVRGMQLFGEGRDLATWLALITQRSGDGSMSKRDFRMLVTAHWARGANLLATDWEHSGDDMARFVARLAELASYPDTIGSSDDAAPAVAASTVTGEVRLSVGEVALDVRTDENVEFALNSAGGSPHMAIMGGVGSGKTRTAVHILKAMRRFGSVPLLAFDFKGDLAEGLSAAYGADVLRPPEESIPLDVLHVGSDDDTAIKTAAARIRDSIASVKSRRPSGVRSEALREAVTATLRSGAGGAITLADAADRSRSFARDGTRNARCADARARPGGPDLRPDRLHVGVDDPRQMPNIVVHVPVAAWGRAPRPSAASSSVSPWDFAGYRSWTQ